MLWTLREALSKRKLPVFRSEEMAEEQHQWLGTQVGHRKWLVNSRKTLQCDTRKSLHHPMLGFLIKGGFLSMVLKMCSLGLWGASLENGGTVPCILPLVSRKQRSMVICSSDCAGYFQLFVLHNKQGTSHKIAMHFPGFPSRHFQLWECLCLLVQINTIMNRI